jgi:hypothetical protein
MDLQNIGNAMKLITLFEQLNFGDLSEEGKSFLAELESLLDFPALQHILQPAIKDEQALEALFAKYKPAIQEIETVAEQVAAALPKKKANPKPATK